MRQVSYCEVFTMSLQPVTNIILRTYLRYVVASLNAERAFSKATVERERKRQMAIDRMQARCSADLALLEAAR